MSDNKTLPDKAVTGEIIRLDSLEDISKFALEVKKFIDKQHLWMKMQDKAYVFVEGWQFMGGLLGITPMVEDVINQSEGDEYKYRAEVKLYKGDKIVSSGMAVCSNKEPGKARFSEFAIASMAQTRAIGKAYRVYLGWVMKMAGYESTPLEEMQGVSVANEPQAAKPPVDNSAIDQAKARLNRAATYEEMQSTWDKLPTGIRNELVEFINERAKDFLFDKEGDNA